MANILLIILHDTNLLPHLLRAWNDIGLPGATILKSAGGHRSHTWLNQVGLGTINHLFETKEVQNRTLIAIVEDEILLEQAIAEAERVVGGFDRPNSGLLVVLPATQVKGLQKVTQKFSQTILPPAVMPNWVALRNTPVEEVVAVLDLEPTIVKADTPLEDIALKNADTSQCSRCMRCN